MGFRSGHQLAFWVKKRNGDVRNLNTTPVQCQNGAINKFRLERQTSDNPVGATGKFKIAHTCSNMQLHDKTTHYTPWRDDGLGNSVYLDQHNLSCPAGKVMTDFVLETNHADDNAIVGSRELSTVENFPGFGLVGDAIKVQALRNTKMRFKYGCATPSM